MLVSSDLSMFFHPFVVSPKGFVGTFKAFLLLLSNFFVRPVSFAGRSCFDRFSFSDNGLNGARRDIHSLRYCFVTLPYFKILHNFTPEPSHVFHGLHDPVCLKVSPKQ
ncbi:hypothetical protein AMECASPLE_037949 [Ameca splendens]|uniref:Uncharacterized protein n=1 Tax=Ameca splendens TaxID=208324 RepID=A0ABV0YJI9_9TELE